MTIYDLIFDILKNSGIDVYAPNTHKGDCITPYVVVKRVTAGQFQRYSTQIVYYDLLCYAKNYTSCLSLVEKVKTAMKGADFNVRPTLNETEPFFDDAVKGFMASVEYRNYKKL